MRGREIALLMLALLMAVPSAGTSPRVSNYGLDVTFFPGRAFMTAVATISFDPASEPSDSAVFYLHGELGVDSLLVDGRRVESEQQSVLYYFDYFLIANRVAFPLATGRPPHLAVYYSGYFNPSKARSPSDYMRIDGDGIFLRSYGYSLWFPTFLESNSDSYETGFDATIRVPHEYTAVFAGDRLSDGAAGEMRVSRWKALIDLREAQCTAQRFKVVSEGDIHIYHLDDSISTSMAGKILDFVRGLKSDFAGIYRQDISSGQMHVMEMPEFGDISSGNVTGITEGIWHSFETNEWSKRGLAHELVHSYVHTNTKRGDSLYALAIEGFPSYFHLPVLAEYFGETWYDDVMKQTEDEYLLKKRTGLGWRDRPLPKEKALTQISAEEVGIYKDVFVLDDRALLFLNWLYTGMGRDRFFDFTRELFGGDTVTLESFKSLVSKYLPSSKDDVDLWLGSTDYPERLHISRK